MKTGGFCLPSCVFFYKTACKTSDIITITAHTTPLIRIVLLTSFSHLSV